MIVKICIGSSCHLKGSHAVVARLQALVEEKALADKEYWLEMLFYNIKLSVIDYIFG